MIKHVFVLIFLCFLATACQKPEEVQTEPRPTDVRVTVVKQTDIKDEYTLPGIVEAWEHVALSAETTGHIKSVLKKEGDKVQKGEAILRINTESSLANYQSKKVKYDSAKKEYERAVNLYKQNAISTKAFESIEDELTLAEVNFKLANEEYRKNMVISPIDGIIDEIMPSAGEFVSSGIVVARIVQADRLKIYINVPEKDLPYLKKGQTVDIFPATIGKDSKSVKGKLSYIATTSDPQTLTYKARIDVKADQDIRAGKIVRIKIIRKEYKKAFVIPMYSLIDKNGQKVIYIENDGHAKQLPVTVDALIGKEAVITGNLKNNDKLITTGQQFLSDGTLLKVVE